MTKTIKIQVYCNTGYSGCDHNHVEEMDLDDWNAMDDAEKEWYLEDIAKVNMENHIDYGAYVIEDED